MMPEDKGKGKVIAPLGSDDRQEPGPTEGDGTQDKASLSSRLGSSAAQLSRSLFTGGPDTTEMGRVASSTSKGTTSAATGPPVSGENSSFAPNLRQAAAISNNQSVFRSQDSNEISEHATSVEAEFSTFLDGLSASLPSEQTDMENMWTTSQPAVSLDRYSAGSTLAGHSSSIAEQEVRDGARVVDLLTQHGIDEIDTEFESKYSREEIAKLRRALFGDGLSGNETLPQTWDNVLNFIPDFVRPDPVAATGAVNRLRSTESQAVLGVTHGSESESIWVEQWMDVLTRYNDEVWGDLGSLVEQAKEELRHLEQENSDSGNTLPKAVRRLQQILGHVRTARL